jgi:hypothetical protein
VNDIGFPTGISGGDFAGRDEVQAVKAGMCFSVRWRVTDLRRCAEKCFHGRLDDGDEINAQALIETKGVQYRLPLEGLVELDARGCGQTGGACGGSVVLSEVWAHVRPQGRQTRKGPRLSSRGQRHQQRAAPRAHRGLVTPQAPDYNAGMTLRPRIRITAPAL